jgi:hypothetical protein
VAQRGGLPAGEQRRRPPLLRRRAEGTEDVHAAVHPDQDSPLDHALDLAAAHAGRVQLRRRQTPPLPRRGGTKCTDGVRFVRHAPIVAPRA